jgi:hypothetical protein
MEAMPSSNQGVSVFSGSLGVEGQWASVLLLLRSLQALGITFFVGLIVHGINLFPPLFSLGPSKIAAEVPGAGRPFAMLILHKGDFAINFARLDDKAGGPGYALGLLEHRSRKEFVVAGLRTEHPAPPSRHTRLHAAGAGTSYCFLFLQFLR